MILPISGTQTLKHYFVSTFDALYITFDSDDSIAGKGFRVEYRLGEQISPHFPLCAY